mgnify:CR=1 FL=1
MGGGGRRVCVWGGGWWEGREAKWEAEEEQAKEEEEEATGELSIVAIVVGKGIKKAGRWQRAGSLAHRPMPPSQHLHSRF